MEVIDINNIFFVSFFDLGLPGEGGQGGGKRGGVTSLSLHGPSTHKICHPNLFNFLQ